jgi:Pyruvate/2-oxoacid:ferredoxin oxidoreductase gamma subunit
VTKLVPREAIRNAVKESVPAGTEELNLKAFDAGYDYYAEAYGKKETAQVAAPVAAGVHASGVQ